MAMAFGRRLGIENSALIEIGVRQNAVAITRLARSRDFRPNSRWIAIRTGIPLDAVNAALTHLLSNGILVMRSARSWAVAKHLYV